MMFKRIVLAIGLLSQGLWAADIDVNHQKREADIVFDRTSSNQGGLVVVLKVHVEGTLLSHKVEKPDRGYKWQALPAQGNVAPFEGTQKINVSGTFKPIFVGKAQLASGAGAGVGDPVYDWKVNGTLAVVKMITVPASKENPIALAPALESAKPAIKASVTGIKVDNNLSSNTLGGMFDQDKKLAEKFSGLSKTDKALAEAEVQKGMAESLAKNQEKIYADLIEKLAKRYADAVATTYQVSGEYTYPEENFDTGTWANNNASLDGGIAEEITISVGFSFTVGAGILFEVETAVE